MHISSSARIGIVAIIVGIGTLAASNYWLASLESWWYESEYFDLLVFSLALIAIGLVLVIRSSVAFITQQKVGSCLPPFAPHRWSPRARLERRPRPHRAFASLLSVRPSSSLPTVGLLYALTFFLVFVSIWVLTSDYRHPGGLTVHLLSARQDRRILSSGRLVLRIDLQGQWRMNSKRVSPADLPALLDAERARRPEVIVFLDADPDLSYGDVLKAIDTIRGANGQVILLGEKNPVLEK